MKEFKTIDEFSEFMDNCTDEEFEDFFEEIDEKGLNFSIKYLNMLDDVKDDDSNF